MTTSSAKPTRIAILGAGGFVGARLIKLAEATGAFDPIPVLRSYRGLSRLGTAVPRSLVVDTSNLEALTGAFRGADVVVNLTMGDELRVLEDTQLVYKASFQAGARQLIHMSSATVFGRVLDASINDDSPPDENSWMLYARGKAQSETWLRGQQSRKEIQVVTLRPGLIWGPGSNWSEMVADQLIHGTAVLSNNGTGIANLIFVDNLVRIILGVASKLTGPAGFYNVADQETVTWSEYYRGLATRLGYPAESVRLWPDGKLRLKVSHAVEWALQNGTLSQLAKKVWKQWLGSEAKAVIKDKLVGAPSPPSGQRSAEGPPRLSRAHWVLQNTVHKLPITKIQRDYGPIRLVPFSEALDVTAAALDFAGFSNPSKISQPVLQAAVAV